jgi:hypothetical protein
MDEAPPAPTVHAAGAGGRRGARGRIRLGGGSSFAAENTTLRVGDLLVAPVAVVVEVPPGPVAVEVEGCGTLELDAGGRPMTHTFRRLDGLPPYVSP